MALCSEGSAGVRNAVTLMVVVNSPGRQYEMVCCATKEEETEFEGLKRLHGARWTEGLEVDELKGECQKDFTSRDWGWTTCMAFANKIVPRPTSK